MSILKNTAVFCALVGLSLSVSGVGRAGAMRDQSGPVFYNGETINIERYTSKAKKKRALLTATEVNWLLTESEENPEPANDLRLTQEEKTELGMEVLPEDPVRMELTRAELARVYLVMDTEASFIGKSKSAHYLYTGNIPHFAAEDLELYVSKVGLTLRVKAWTDQAFIDNYEYALLTRWMKIYRDFQDPSLSFEALKDPRSLLATLKTASAKNWLKVALQYMHHGLEDSDPELYASRSLKKAEYKNVILRAMLRQMLADPKLETEDGVELYKQLSDPALRSARVANSRELFAKNLAENFTNDSSHSARGTTSVGYLTFVYPIAANQLGPYNQPAEGIYPFGGRGLTYASARWMSDFWGDEYGGLPFMEVSDGVGFHGPITAKESMSLWYLQRGYVSHGCFRMDPSDVMEFRAILPANAFGANSKSFPMQIMQWPDVAATTESGELEVMDVKYYFFQNTLASGLSSYLLPENQAPLPTPSGTPPSTSSPTRPRANAQTSFWKDHFSKWTARKSFYDPSQGKKVTIGYDAENAAITNAPVYGIVKGRLAVVKTSPTAKIRSYPSRPTNIIQYRERGAVNDDSTYKGLGEGGGTYGLDFDGKYPPSRFIRY